MESLEPLRLRLSRGVDQAHFRVSVSVPSQFGGGETESKLPFFENGVDWLRTVRNAVGATRFVPDHFQRAGEQDWMVENSLLSEDRSGFHPNMHANIGQVLYQALFPESSPVKNALQKAIILAQTQETELHIQLQIDANISQYARLHDYPWELLHDDQDFLAHRHHVVFSRYIDYDAAPPNLPRFKQINVLLISSTAFDPNNELEELSKDEQEAVRQVLKKAQDKKYIHLDELKPATFRELQAYLSEHRGEKVPHVIHFDGHGIFGMRCQQCRKIYKGTKTDVCDQPCGAKLPQPQGYLVFENELGEAEYVSAKELGTRLGKQRGVALVVLSACKSGLSLGSHSVFNGVAQNLISQRIPAVVAMQYSVLVDGATAFAEGFYRSLGERDSLALAVSQGRDMMGIESNQWYRPVLYLRWKDNEGGQIFAVEPATSPPFGKLSEPLKLPSHWQPDLINALLHQSDCQSKLELTNAIGELENIANEAPSLQFAKRWLGDEHDRWKLASTLTKKAFPVSYLKTYPTLKAKEEAKNKIHLNLYNCLNWLAEAFQTGLAKEIDDFKEYLIEHPLNYYVDALNLLKDKAKQDFFDNEDVINVINDYINMLSDKIGF